MWGRRLSDAKTSVIACDKIVESFLVVGGQWTPQGRLAGAHTSSQKQGSLQILGLVYWHGLRHG